MRSSTDSRMTSVHNRPWSIQMISGPILCKNVSKWLKGVYILNELRASQHFFKTAGKLQKQAIAAAVQNTARAGCERRRDRRAPRIGKAYTDVKKEISGLL